MDFSTALRMLKDGHLLQRAGWNGKGMWIQLQWPDTNSKMTQPYIYMNPTDTCRVPWVASQTDLLSEDWQQLK